MPGSEQNRHPHFRTIRYASDYRAFLPAPLPPTIELNGELAAALARGARVRTPRRRGPQVSELAYVHPLLRSPGNNAAKPDCRNLM